MTNSAQDYASREEHPSGPQLNFSYYTPEESRKREMGAMVLGAVGGFALGFMVFTALSAVL